MARFLISISYLLSDLLYRLIRSVGLPTINRFAMGGAIIFLLSLLLIDNNSGLNVKIGIISSLLLMPWLVHKISERIVSKLYIPFWKIWVPILADHTWLQKLTGIKVCQKKRGVDSQEYDSEKNSPKQPPPSESLQRTEPEIDFFMGTSSLEQVKKRYRDLVKIYHPDTTGGSTEYTNMINQQYEREKEKYQA